MTKSIWFVTGGKGVGKSTTLARFPKPSELDKMMVFDTEDSMSDILGENERLGVKFGQYIRAYDRLKSYLKLSGDDWNKELIDRIAQGKLPWRNEAERYGLAEYWEWFTRQLSTYLIPGQFKYLAIDTIEPIEASCAAWAEANKDKSGWRTRSFAQCEIEAIRPLLENTFEAVHQTGVEHILLSSHLKSPWIEVGGKSRPVYDRVKPGGRLKVWSRISTAMLWLVKPPYPANANNAPSAVVMKARVGKTEIDGDEWVLSNPIPPRIPAFSWAEWRRYQKEGWDSLNPQPGETISKQENEMMSELLSQQEYALMIAEQQAAVYESVGTKSLFATDDTVDIVKKQTWQERAREMLASGVEDMLAIAKEVGKPLPIVKRELGQ